MRKTAGIGLCISLALLLIACSSLSGQQSASPNVAVFVSTTHPRDSQGETVYDRDENPPKGAAVVPGTLADPVVVTRAKAKIPFSSRSHHRKLSIIVQGVVTVSGDVIDAEVLNDDGDTALAKNCAEAFGLFKFKPSTLNGKPVAVLIQVPFRFNMF